MPVRTRSRTLQLPVALSESEVAARFHRMGELLGEKATLIEDARAEATARREHLREIDAELEQLGCEARRGAAEREVQCVEELDLDTLEARLVRLDTGEVLQRRPLSPDERQLSLDDLN